MERFVVGFIRASLVWLAVGVVLGVAMAVWPGQTLAYRPAHLHANVLGFVSMMIFGVAYHVIPRFAGNPLRSRRLPMLHLWTANVGLLAMVAGWVARVHGVAGAGPVLGIGGALGALGAALFIVNVWRTLDGVAAPAPSGGPPLTRIGVPLPGHR